MNCNRRVKVWDVPTRLFHCLLVVSIMGSWLSIEQRLMYWHQGFGYLTIALLVFRCLWGIVGSTTARFSHFISHPKKSWCYLCDSLQLKSVVYSGHNPAGAWMVIVFIVLILAQAVSGLLSNNEVGFSGVLADKVSKDLSDQLTQWHAYIFNAILVAIWLHLVAIFFYVLVKKQNLIRAMITGSKPREQVPSNDPLEFYQVKYLVLCIVIAIALPVYLIVLGLD